jgi:hypothetical protein
MDTLSHALWGRGLFGYRGMPWLALFFGAMPDLASFGILIVVNIFNGFRPQFGGPPPLESLPFFVLERMWPLQCWAGRSTYCWISLFIQRNTFQQNCFTL